MTNIEKIRQLLKGKIALAKVSADNVDYLISMSIKEAKEILALLPCETCNDTSVVPKLSLADIRGQGYMVYHPCPDCQPCQTCKGTRKVPAIDRSGKFPLGKMECPDCT